MNWPRIKTILIYLLIFANLVLAGNYLFWRDERATLIKDSVSDISRLYTVKGVEILTNIGTFPARLPGKQIEQHRFSESYVNLILGDAPAKKGNIYSHADKSCKIQEYSLTISAPSDLLETIEDSKNLELKGPLDLSVSEQAKYLGLAEKALEDSFIHIDYQEIDVYKYGEYSVIKLNQQFGSYIYEESKIFIWYKDSEFAGLYTENIAAYVGENTVTYDIISVNTALFKAIPKLESADSLLAVDIVYKLNDESQLAGEIVQGESLPYYKLQFIKSSPIYILAVQ